MFLINESGSVGCLLLDSLWVKEYHFFYMHSIADAHVIGKRFWCVNERLRQKNKTLTKIYTASDTVQATDLYSRLLGSEHPCLRALVRLRVPLAFPWTEPPPRPWRPLLPARLELPPRPCFLAAAAVSTLAARHLSPLRCRRRFELVYRCQSCEWSQNRIYGS